MVIIILIIFLLWFYFVSFKKERVVYGVTFSQVFAEDLGLDWQQVYSASLDELKIKNYRLVAYWNRIEKKQGVFDFSDLDWQIEEAAKRDAKVILAVGQRTPRWPECFIPDWAADFTDGQRQEALLNYLKVMINHYKNYNNIVYWQVENEPLLSVFGECPPPSFNNLKEEVNLVKSLDDRQVILTDSGELSFWIRTAQIADVLGTSIYHSIYNKWWGYFYYPYPPAFYYLHAKIIKAFFPVKEVIVSEFQFEPWARKDITEISLDEQFRSFDLNRFRRNYRYAQRSGFSEVYLWGVEWWYWLKEEKGIGDFWEEAKKIWQE